MKCLEYLECVCVEGQQGIDALNEISEMLGYERQPFKNGSPLELFLADNPDAIHALMEWIDSQPVFENMLYFEDDEN